jgi:hypothetical protein
MIQLLGNCFGQEASTLYAGGACAPAAVHAPSVSKQLPIENKTPFVHPVKLGMTILQIASRVLEFDFRVEREYTPDRPSGECFRKVFRPDV